MRKAIGIILIVLILVVDIGAWATINLPANITYSNEFGSYVTLLYTGQPTFQGINHNLNILLNNMYKEFPNSSTDYNHTYNSPFPWDHIYENSLAANKLYIISAINRSIYYEQQFANNSKTATTYSDVYNTAIQNMRNEMHCGQTTCRNATFQSGIDWVINGAWYLQNRSDAYWDWYVLIPITAIIFIIGISLIVLDDNY